MQVTVKSAPHAVVFVNATEVSKETWGTYDLTPSILRAIQSGDLLVAIEDKEIGEEARVDTTVKTTESPAKGLADDGDRSYSGDTAKSQRRPRSGE